MKFICKAVNYLKSKSLYFFTIIALVVAIFIVTLNLILTLLFTSRCTLISHIDDVCDKEHSTYDIVHKELYIDKKIEPIINDNKVVYLTFDDGPSERTIEILDILKEYDIKATFFVTVQEEKKNTKDILRRIAFEGHTIGVHSYSHNYNEIYKSVNSFLDDFNEIYNYIFNATGVKAEIFRFPGGSKNSYNTSTYKDIIREMTLRGFVYYDWNVDSKDSIGDFSANTIYEKSIKDIDTLNRAFILYHDSVDRKSTVKALEKTILHLKEKGFTFSKITRNVKPVVMGGNKL